MKHRLSLIVTILTISGAGLLPAQEAQQTQQVPLEYFGAQISNEIDTTSTGCYIGTAGSVVYDSITGFNYILSNSHVLAREGQGVIGENIMHTVSTACNLNAVHVGELAAHVPLQFGRKSTNRVDAALARITPNVVPATDATGVLHIGDSLSHLFGVSSTTRAPVIGMAVKKSGRTTGLTAAGISQIGVNVVVRYNGGRAYFTDQFMVGSAGFSDGGDSGSLIVTDDAHANPVGLLFAGSSTSTIGNPIGYVLSELAAQLGPNASLVFGATPDKGTYELTPPTDGGGDDGGNTGGPGNGKGGGKPKTSDTEKLNGLSKAIAVRDRNEARLLEQDGILGSGIGLSNGSPSITVFVNRDHSFAARNLPTSIEGVPVVIQITDEFVAF